MTQHLTLVTKLSSGAKIQTYDGRPHIVVPCVAVVEGVLNGDLVLMEQVARSLQSWNGRPVTVAHPQADGSFVSANEPKTHERAIGFTFGAKIKNNKLAMDLWIDQQRADRLGHGDIAAGLMGGRLYEVSVGFFCEPLAVNGDHAGKQYEAVPTNIQPDHLAILVDEKGACSVEDGCGTRAYKKGAKMNIQEALATLRKAFGATDGGCACAATAGEDLLAKAEELHSHNKIDDETHQTITDLEPGAREATARFLSALSFSDPKTGDEKETPMSADTTNQTTPAPAPVTMADVEKAMETKLSAMTDAFMAKLDERDAKAARDAEVATLAGRISGYSSNKLTVEQLKAMDLDALKALDETLKPVTHDYSGRGGFATNAAAPSGEASEPLRAPVLNFKKEA